MKSRKSMIGNAVFFLALFGLTAYAVLKGKEISQLIRVMHSVRPVYYAAGFIFINLFVWCESYIIYRMLRVLQYQQVPKRNCIKYSYVGFFFSCITPSASGGQPAQLYYMNRDKVDVSVGAVILLIVTILYKFVLVFLGTLIFIFRHSLISEYIQGAAFFFYLGMALNVICVIVMFLLVFQQTLASRMIIGLVKGLEKIHVLRRKEERIRKLEDSMMEYHKAAAVIQEHKKLIAGMFGVTLVQRLIHFSITYLIYRGLGLSALGIVDVVLEIRRYESQKAGLADYLGKEQERSNCKNRLEVHYLSNLNLLNGADYHGHSVSKNCNDLWRDDLLRNKATCEEHSNKHNCK